MDAKTSTVWDSPFGQPLQVGELSSVFVSMPSRRFGKSEMVRQMAQTVRSAAAGLGATLIIHDEHFRYHRHLAIDIDPGCLDNRDRTHFERGGRYRQPPRASNEKPPEPGMVRMRDRSGELVWRKLGKGKA